MLKSTTWYGPVWEWLLMNPGRTYMPVASISRSPDAGRAASTRFVPEMAAMRSPSMTMSTGPRAGAPVPAT